MMDDFLSLRCSIPGGLEDELPALLESWTVLGCEVGQPGGELLPLTVYFRGDDTASAEGVAAALAAAGASDFTRTAVADADWLAGYRSQVTAFAVGEGWWVDPHPEAPTPAPPGRRRLVMPPRTAFGSGSHESTRLALRAMEAIDIAGASVLDVGTGSGILAFAADRRGAGRVLAVDVDPAAVLTASEIADEQEWRPRVHFALASASAAAADRFDLVLCNMISDHLLPLLGDLRRALAAAGVVVLSGLLVSESDLVLAELADHGLSLRARDAAGEWLALVVEREP